MPKYLDDNRKKLQEQQPAQTVQKQPLQPSPKTQAPAQTTATAPAPMEKQSTAQQPAAQQSQPVTQAPAQTQTAAPSAAEQAQQLLSQQPGAYQSKWGSSIDDVLEQLMNPQEFTYDPNTDPLYLMLRDQSIRDGKLAMEDTMGQAAQLTGGYGNSHAQMLGQQTYQGYMQNVNDLVPELREQARADYDAQNDALLQQLGLMMDQDSQDYSRYLDELERQRYEEQLAYEREQDALANERYDREWQYQQNRDALDDQRYADELAYNRGQDAYDRLLEMILTTGYQPTAEELAAAGMTEAQAKAWRSYYEGSVGGGGSGGGSGRGSGSASGSGSGGGGSSAADIVNAAVDNLFGALRGENATEGGDVQEMPKDYAGVVSEIEMLKGNGMPDSAVSEYLDDVLGAGIITREQYAELMKKYGKQTDSGRSTGGGSFGNNGTSSGLRTGGYGGGNSRKNRYDRMN